MSRARILAAWILAWVITAALIAATRYESRDPDSQLYAALSARLVREPARTWIAPEWWGLWNSTGPYAEHPVGMFVVPAVLGRAGYPPEQAAYAVNALYQAATFALVAAIAGTVVPRRQAIAIACAVQILPVAFVFRIRANQEYGVLAWLLLAVFATERARDRPAWIAGMFAGFCGVLLLKGVFAVMVPIACALWLVSRTTTRGDVARTIPAWTAVLLMPMVGAAVAWVYEAAYVHVTGRSFLALYRSRQLPPELTTWGGLVARVAYTASWYTSRVLWYPFPWSLFAVGAVIVALRRGQWRPWSTEHGGDPGPRQGAWFALATAFALTAMFSLAHRKADRYIFPVYFLVGAAGAGVAAARSPALARAFGYLDRSWAPALVYVLLVLASLLFSGRLPEFTFWRT